MCGPKHKSHPGPQGWLHQTLMDLLGGTVLGRYRPPILAAPTINGRSWLSRPLTRMFRRTSRVSICQSPRKNAKDVRQSTAPTLRQISTRRVRHRIIAVTPPLKQAPYTLGTGLRVLPWHCLTVGWGQWPGSIGISMGKLRKICQIT